MSAWRLLSSATGLPTRGYLFTYRSPAGREAIELMMNGLIAAERVLRKHRADGWNPGRAARVAWG